MTRRIKLPACYLKSISLSLICLWLLATLQSYYAYEQIKPSFYIVPSLVAIVIGTATGYLLTIRRELRTTVDKFRAIADQAQEFIYLRHVDGHYEYVSPSCERITGSTARQFYTEPNLMDRLIHPDDRAMWENHVHRVNKGGVAESFDIRLLSDEGEVRWINHICMPVYDERGKEVSIRSTNLDITDRKESEAKLRQATAIFMQINEGVVVTDAEARVLAVNDAFLEISGYAEEEVIGKNPRLWKSQKHHEFFYRNMWATLIETRKWRGEIINRRKNGDIYPAWLTITAVTDEQGRIINYISVLSDNSTIKQSQERADYLAHHDVLTDLPNRHLFNDRLEHALQRGHRQGVLVAILFIDLDNFKSINEGLGYPVGDRVLQETATRMVQLVREEDTVARIAGDEFAIILEDIKDPESVAKITGKLLEAFRPPFFIDNDELHVSVSIGISLYPDDGDDVTTLIKNADTAMYKAKEMGKAGYCFYTQALTEAAQERLQLGNRLRKALARNELLLHYQPQYSLHSGELVGAEALVRWQTDDLGLVPPARFIPLAESNGLILPIGEWVLYEACVQARKWQQGGLDIKRIGVNVSGLQIQQGAIVTSVKNALKTTGLDPACLELEITENFIMQQADDAIAILEELRGLGVMLAIDDFGTGYSSLSYLKLLPVNRLKVDRSFVKDIARDSNSEAIVRAVIALARSLQLQVIAEGVEKAEQGQFLQAEGCDEVQGFYYARPLPADQFTALLEQSLSTESVSG